MSNSTEQFKPILSFESIFSFVGINSIFKKAGFIKRSGASVEDLFLTLVSSVFYGNKNLFRLFSSPIGKAKDFGSFDSIQYPVIIKPVDSSSNSGISICASSENLAGAIQHASDCSKTNSIIIEQYIDGEEISCTYVIKDHKAKMVCMGTKYPYVDENGLRALANAYLYPSPSINEYMAQEDENVKEMFINEGLNNCTVFVQGMYKDGKSYIFEAGLRMEGTGSFRITSELCKQNFLHFQK